MTERAHALLADEIEPGAWSWDEQVKAGAKGTAWTGVRNHQAKLNLMKMKKGDRASSITPMSARRRSASSR